MCIRDRCGTYPFFFYIRVFSEYLFNNAYENHLSLQYINSIPDADVGSDLANPLDSSRGYRALIGENLYHVLSTLLKNRITEQLLNNTRFEQAK